MITAHQNPLWTVPQVAEFLGMSLSWVYKKSNEGELPCIRLGSSVRFDPNVITEFARGMGNNAHRKIALKK